MTPINESILKMVLASPVGKAMSPADQDALRAALETTDARDVGGWLGDQIRKAATVTKGDYDGHPFRGNQWSDASGVGAGGASGGPKGGKASTADIKASARFDTLYSEAGNKALEKVYLKWAKTADFSRPTSELLKDFDQALKDSGLEAEHSEIRDTVVREQVGDRITEIRDEMGFDSKQRRDDEARAKAEGKKAKAAEYRRIQAERADAERQRRIDSGEVRVLDKKDMKEPLTGEAKTTFNAARKATLSAIDLTDDAIEELRGIADRIGREKLGKDKAFEFMEAIDSAQEQVDRIHDVVQSGKPTIGTALRLAELGANEAENIKNDLRSALRVLDSSRPKPQGRQSRDILGTDSAWSRTTAALQSAMDSDFGINFDKIEYESSDL